MNRNMALRNERNEDKDNAETLEKKLAKVEEAAATSSVAAEER
jgi:hypothetical protein